MGEINKTSLIFGYLNQLSNTVCEFSILFDIPGLFENPIASHGLRTSRFTLLETHTSAPHFFIRQENKADAGRPVFQTDGHKLGIFWLAAYIERREENVVIGGSENFFVNSLTIFLNSSFRLIAIPRIFSRSMINCLNAQV